MRTQVELYCPFKRDLTWITQEMIESYAAARLTPGKKTGDEIALTLAGGNGHRAKILMEVLDQHPHFEELKAEILEEFGESHFIKRKSKAFMIAEIEYRMENEQDNEVYVKLHKEWRELVGYVTKPTEAAPVINNISLTQNTGIKFDAHNPKEVARVYHSLMG